MRVPALVLLGFSLCLAAATLSAADVSEDDLEKLISDTPKGAAPTPAKPTVTQTVKPKPLPPRSPANAKTAPSSTSNANTAPVPPGLSEILNEPAPPSLPSSIPIAPPTPYPLVELFSLDKNPGRGSLEYVKAEDQKETIQFGTESGHYIVGMVFSQDTIPEQVRADLQRADVIQLAMGTLSGSTMGRVGQFGAATLMVQRGSKPQRVVPLRIPGAGESALPESGFFLFTSPGMQAQATDEEKLKGTFFAKGGSVSLAASTAPKSITITADGQKVPFKMQGMRMEINAVLITPFNSQEQKLHGRIEFPLYWPEGTVGKQLARRMSEATFNSKSAITIPEKTPSRRMVTEQPAKSKKAKRKPASPAARPPTDPDDF